MNRISNNFAFRDSMAAKNIIISFLQALQKAHFFHPIISLTYYFNVFFGRLNISFIVSEQFE